VIVGIDGEDMYRKQPGKVAALLLGLPGYKHVYVCVCWRS